MYKEGVEGGAIRLSGTDRLNLLNIGLMVVSCGVALFMPFELFLFAYAILGPAHYLTEISWLQKRQFFTPRKYDAWLLAALAVMVILPLTATTTFGDQERSQAAAYTLIAFGAALLLILTDKLLVRLLGLIPVVAFALLVLNPLGTMGVLVGVFVPTLIHVYLFTGFFMIYGALKERSRTGYAAFAVFLVCPVLFLALNPAVWKPSAYVVISYWNNFSFLNMAILGLELPRTVAEARAAMDQVFSSGTGRTVMRFIAFAYTYHYLNWFSKTSIIKWHEVGLPRLIAVAAIWIGSIGLYVYNYALGFKFLFCLSLLHVYLEFPLNHISILGTGRELRSMIWGSREVVPSQPVAAKRQRLGRRQRA